MALAQTRAAWFRQGVGIINQFRCGSRLTLRIRIPAVSRLSSSSSSSSSSWQHQEQQQRNAEKQSLQESSSPFQILNVSPTTSYSSVKKAFLRLALELHPDTKGGKDDDDDDATTWKFIRVRQAFESIREAPDGTCIIVDDNSTFNNDDDNASFHDWIQQETGCDWSFYMDQKTRRQVAEVSRTMSRGGLDRGGMWAMAESIAREEQEGGNKQSTSGQLQAPTSIRRRRQR